MFEVIVRNITNLGDSSITSCITIVAAIYLVLIKEKRAALAIVAAFVVSASLIAILKITFYSACPGSIPLPALRSPSGHSAISLAVFGTIAAIISSSLATKWKPIPYVLVFLLAVPIAISRVLLGAHTVPEILAGLGLGLAITYGVWRVLLRGQTVYHGRISTLALLTIAAMLILNGVHFPAEAIIDLISTQMRMHMHTC